MPRDATVRLLRLRPVVEVARMLKRRLAGILSYFDHRITNAASESLNSRIQAIRVAARGHWNEGATPFVWVKTAEEILAKAVRKHQDDSGAQH